MRVRSRSGRELKLSLGVDAESAHRNPWGEVAGGLPHRTRALVRHLEWVIKCRGEPADLLFALDPGWQHPELWGHPNGHNSTCTQNVIGTQEETGEPLQGSSEMEAREKRRRVGGWGVGKPWYSAEDASGELSNHP